MKVKDNRPGSKRVTRVNVDTGAFRALTDQVASQAAEVADLRQEVGRVTFEHTLADMCLAAGEADGFRRASLPAPGRPACPAARSPWW